MQRQRDAAEEIGSFLHKELQDGQIVATTSNRLVETLDAGQLVVDFLQSLDDDILKVAIDESCQLAGNERAGDAHLAIHTVHRL